VDAARASRRGIGGHSLICPFHAKQLIKGYFSTAVTLGVEFPRRAHPMINLHIKEK